MIKRLIVLILLPAALLISGGAAKIKPTNGSCVVAGTSVSATGLPTDQVINFLITDNAGTTGFVLGQTDDGTWTVTVPAPTSPTSYQFVSKTWGKDGSHYTTFAACS